MNRRSEVLSKLSALLLSTIVTLVLLVGAYELFKNVEYSRWKEDFDNFGWLGKITVPSENPTLLWEYRPYGKHGGTRTNRYGFRDRDYRSTAKDANTFRIAFAGDSITLGMGVRLRETYFRLFEVAADNNRAQRRIQALGFAVDGYNTPQIVEMVRTKVLSFSPDRVVYVMCANDFDFAESSGEKMRYFRKPRSFFLERLDKVVRNLRGGDFHLYHFEKNKTEVFRHILDLKGLLERERIGFQLVLVPIFPASPLTFDDYPLEDMHRAVAEFARENAISFLDLKEGFAATGRLPSDYALDVWHPNAEGHRVIAERLVPFVLAEPSS